MTGAKKKSNFWKKWYSPPLVKDDVIKIVEEDPKIDVCKFAELFS